MPRTALARALRRGRDVLPMLRPAIAATAALVAAVCGPGTAAAPDGGAVPSDAPRPRPDAGPPPPPYACDGDVTVLEGVLGETATLDLDTATTPERPRDLGPACGNVGTTARWAGQEIIEYHVPGTGRVGVTFDTRLPRTAANFNTLVQIRSACARIPDTRFPPTCFDDVSGSEPRAAGGFEAMGGEVVYLVVTAYSDPPAAAMQVDEGPLSIAITPRANTPPTLESASVLLSGDAALVAATATDAETPIVGYALSLFTAAGQVDFDGDGVREPEDVIVFAFDAVTGAGPYLGEHEITPDDDGYQIATYCRTVGCVEAGIAVFDASYATSATLRVPVTEATVVGPGDACDRENLCAAGLVCTAGTCDVTPAAAMVCTAAIPIPIAMPVDAMPVVASATGVVGAGAGVFYGTCSDLGTPMDATPGREAVYTIELTGAGPYDLTLTTRRPGTGTRDTVLYVRTDCYDETSTIGCQDDDAASVYQSTVSLSNLTPGTYWIFVEDYGGVATGTSAFELQATLTL